MNTLIDPLGGNLWLQAVGNDFSIFADKVVSIGMAEALSETRTALRYGYGPTRSKPCSGNS